MIPTERTTEFPEGYFQGMGNEGAGVVVAAGASSEAQALIGKRVAARTGTSYAEYAKTNIMNPLLTVLPDGCSAEDGASIFVNPLTVLVFVFCPNRHCNHNRDRNRTRRDRNQNRKVLGFVNTMQEEGHTAMVHTAAASQLGRMLLKVCKAEGIPLVNVVRNEASVQIMKELGAEHVVNMQAKSFKQDLVAALITTKATIAFDATGGGSMASDIILAMEAAVKANGMTGAGFYGTPTHKQA